VHLTRNSELEGVKEMKKLVSITMVLLLLSGVVFAGGASEKTTAAPAATTTEKAATSGVPAHKAELVQTVRCFYPGTVRKIF
jgi:hypothetical protein